MIENLSYDSQCIITPAQKKRMDDTVLRWFAEYKAATGDTIVNLQTRVALGERLYGAQTMYILVGLEWPLEDWR